MNSLEEVSSQRVDSKRKEKREKPYTRAQMLSYVGKEAEISPGHRLSHAALWSPCGSTGTEGFVFLDVESAQAFFQETGLTAVLPQGVEGHLVLCNGTNS